MSSGGFLSRVGAAHPSAVSQASNTLTEITSFLDGLGLDKDLLITLGIEASQTTFVDGIGSISSPSVHSVLGLIPDMVLSFSSSDEKQARKMLVKAFPRLTAFNKSRSLIKSLPLEDREIATKLALCVKPSLFKTEDLFRSTLAESKSGSSPRLLESFWDSFSFY